jgi:hypothetical protein
MIEWSGRGFLRVKRFYFANENIENAETAMITRTATMIGALAGLLGSARSTPGAAATDPCSLLSEAEVSAALGVPVTIVKSGSDAQHCHWQQQGKRGTTVVDARLLVETAKTYDAAKNTMGMSGKLTRVPVTGVGDDAYYLVGSRDVPLFAKRGGAALRVAVDGKGWSAAQIKAKEQALASALLGKL